MNIMDLIERSNEEQADPTRERGVLMTEQTLISPPPAFAAAANVRDPAIYEHAQRDPAAFWAEQATRLNWRRAWDRPLDWETPWAKWFVGGSLNASENCVDRHLATWRKNKAAIIWEGEPGDQRVLTYRDLHREVGRVATVLRRLGVGSGDRVAIYMPVIPELPIAMLACARLGAVHVVVYSGYSPDALADRVADCGARVIVTADAGYHRGNIVPLKDNVDVALSACQGVERVLVVRRAGEQQTSIAMRPQRDIWWHEAVDDAPWDAVVPEAVPSEHPLAIMYASGAAGRPKGLLHTTGGYLVGAATTANWIYDLKEEDVFFCTADLGWSIGQTYGVYGPLLNGATVLLHEGTADMPNRDRYWRLVARHGVTTFVTTPSTIRMTMRAGGPPAERHDLSSLRLLSTVGEPISTDEWRWFHERIGGGRCPIVNAWWQTEAGMAMIAPLPGITLLKPGSATLPLPGVAMDVVDDQGFPVGPDVPGYLVVTAPWPGMARSIWGDPERYYRQYWGRFEATYVTGDGARRDADGYYWLLGRVDDVLNVAGQRLSSIEIENALAEHPSVAEAAVIGVRHPLKGQAVVAWVVMAPGQAASDAMSVELKAHVAEKIGGMARPDQIYYLAALPRTPGSPVVMRRLLRAVAEGRVPGGAAALLDPDVLAEYAEPLG
jgi:acetyl-CoA synthetase